MNKKKETGQCEEKETIDQMMHSIKESEHNDQNESKDMHPLIQILFSSYAPQCIGITGPVHCGKTTFLYNIALHYYSVPATELRSPSGPVFLIDAFTDIGEDFRAFYEMYLMTFCNRRGKIPNTLLIDDVDQMRIESQTQLYAFVQRFLSRIRIVFTYTNSHQVFPPLLNQCLPIYMEMRHHPSPTAIAQSFKYLAQSCTKKERPIQTIFKITEIWKTLYRDGILVADIFAFIRDYIVNEARSKQSIWSDAQLFAFYEWVSRFMHTRPSEHLIELFFLASALVNQPFVDKPFSTY